MITRPPPCCACTRLGKPRHSSIGAESQLPMIYRAAGPCQHQQQGARTWRSVAPPS